MDLLGRSSLFRQAQQLIDEFEHDHPPSLPLMMSILFNAREQRQMGLANKIAHRIRLHFNHDEECLKNEVEPPAHELTEEESRLWGHGELLAVFFNLIQQPIPLTIAVSVNLLVCRSCRESSSLSLSLAIEGVSPSCR